MSFILRSNLVDKQILIFCKRDFGIVSVCLGGSKTQVGSSGYISLNK
jgi:hypothetical protein